MSEQTKQATVARNDAPPLNLEHALVDDIYARDEPLTIER